MCGCVKNFGSPDRGQVMKYQDSLSQKFTLVAWDQRGAGFAYDKNEAKTLALTNRTFFRISAWSLDS